MRIRRLALLFLAIVVLSAQARPRWVLVWHGEFDGPRNSPQIDLNGTTTSAAGGGETMNLKRTPITSTTSFKMAAGTL